jgi:sugar phosphate isomerase/epimerase
MKLAVAIADQRAGPSAFVVWRGFEASCEKAAAYGYDGVELALRAREDVAAGALKKTLRACHLEVSAISTGQVFADMNLYLTNPDRQRRHEAIGVLRSLAELAGEFGAMLNLGRARGFVDPSQTRREAEDLFFDAVAQLLPAAEALGVTLLIEPVNRYELNFINSVEQCAALLGARPSGKVGVMPDLFHMNIEDARIGVSLKNAGALVKYVHLADSNRLAPGWGHLDFGEVFQALREIHYNGWLSVEILPIPSPDAAAKQAADYIRPFIDANPSLFGKNDGLG